MKRLPLFFLACVLGGAGGAVGSMIGHFFGPRGLWVCGVVGGVIGCVLAAQIAVWRGWIIRAQYWPTLIGSVVGFALACVIVVNTLSSPVGPILSTTLIGAGAVLGTLRKGPAGSPDINAR